MAKAAPVTKPTFETVIKLLDNGSWTLENIASQSQLSVSTIKHIRQAKTWGTWQRRRKIKAQKNLAANQTVKVKAARKARKPAAVIADEEDKLQSSLDSLTTGLIRDVLTNQTKILSKLKEMDRKVDISLSDVADVKYDTGRIRWNQLNPFRRKK